MINVFDEREEVCEDVVKIHTLEGKAGRTFFGRVGTAEGLFLITRTGIAILYDSESGDLDRYFNFKYVDGKSTSTTVIIRKWVDLDIYWREIC